MFVFSSSNTDMGVSPKLCVKLKMEKFLEDIKKVKTSQKMIKTASFDSSSASNDVLRIFAKALSEMKIKTEIDLGELFKRIFAASNEKSSSREETIKIASKEIKDSHYQVDISKEPVEKNGMKLFMVSAYLRDAYLGRYLIKRNYFYLSDNEKKANDIFDEIGSKIRDVKSRYYKDGIAVKAITTEIFEKLQSIKSDIEIPENDLGTTVKRS